LGSRVIWSVCSTVSWFRCKEAQTYYTSPY